MALAPASPEGDAYPGLQFAERSPTLRDMADRWVTVREYAAARGVTPDAVLRTIKRDRLGLPVRRSNSDGRGAWEILADLPEPGPPSPPPPDAALLIAERDRALADRDAERQRLEDARIQHAAELRELQAKIADHAGRTATAEAGAAQLRKELEALRARPWWRRLLDV